MDVVALHEHVRRAVLGVDALFAALPHVVAGDSHPIALGDADVLLPAAGTGAHHLVPVDHDPARAVRQDAGAAGVGHVVALDDDVLGVAREDPYPLRVDDPQRRHHDVGLLGHVEEPVPAAPPLPRQVSAIDRDRLAGVGGEGDVSAGFAGAVGCHALAVEALPDVHRVAGAERVGGLLDGPPGLLDGARVSVIAGRGYEVRHRTASICSRRQSGDGGHE